MSLLNVFHVAGSALHAQSLRLNTTASNLANADSVTSSNGQPYRAKQVVFAATPMGGAQAGQASQGVRVTQVVESAAPLRLVYDPKSPAANAEGYVSMPNVNVVEEMTNMISASRAYQTNADVMGTAKTLMEKTLTIGQG
ncbi:flagellar basal body rod protein FlgC [Zoogloea sp.]|uniref:flagellar basal body rod protein FlgC n=1 Tax=Zoogloea sp. TaxID=49181 RepID=UPI0026062E14|nr:flagellar basal body rod protein FlgC [Zoogloea sp.]MDD3352779.1 flagellar basal body rod protein FlgC [Zoogloea sp.]